ncbi:hypothetical protein AIOL_001549 [Candidatus Rhodobacter oscarellae]|uniref:Uncharacterized protein n=1 Tax=Candidatus Rhodobacter oscarellae TaxID=1675527 RepID=A0A0J9E1I0_9RHOB|nr:hypothetical protein [Candidatus Rhodobacter lobularis]KMW56595.1 hypothetical protein AIOL_001549 [Candidatus Rhodobacter lobularis]
MEIQGRDIATECYRVVVDVDGHNVTGLVPERHAPAFLGIGGRPSHQDAYVWIARNKDKIEAAIAMLARGQGRPKAPFNEITLIEEH